VAQLIRMVFVAGVLALLVACETVFHEDETLRIQTDRESYALGDTARITVTNPGGEAVYVRRCGPRSYRFALLQVDEDGTESVVVRDICRSFNQIRVEIGPRSASELELPLNFDVPRGFDLDAPYRIALYMVGTVNPEPDSSLQNRSNVFFFQLPG